MRCLHEQDPTPSPRGEGDETQRQRRWIPDQVGDDRKEKGSRGVSPPHDEVPSTSSGQALLFWQKDPTPLAPGRGPPGAFASVPVAWASFDFRRVAPYAQDERIITSRSCFPPVRPERSVSEVEGRSDSPRPHIEFAGPGRSHARRRRDMAGLRIEGCWIPD